MTSCVISESVIPPGSFRTVATVYNTVDLDKFRPDGDPVPLPVASDDIVKIGLIATYARWKGHDVFLNALEILHRTPNLPLWHAWIVGGPIYATAGSQWSADELRSMIEAKGLTHLVSLLPFQKDPAGVMRGLDVVVHASSKPEPFGRVIAEAQACGRAGGGGGHGRVGRGVRRWGEPVWRSHERRHKPGRCGSEDWCATAGSGRIWARPARNTSPGGSAVSTYLVSGIRFTARWLDRSRISREFSIDFGQVRGGRSVSFSDRPGRRGEPGRSGVPCSES